LLTTLAEENEQDGGQQDMSTQEPEEQAEQEEEFYTEGLPELLEARREIARYSLPRAKARVQRQRVDSTIPLRTHVKHRKTIKEKLQGFELFGSQIAGERPVSITRFAPSGDMVAAGNWGGGIKLLDVPNLETKATLRGHTGIVGGLTWFPGSTISSSNVSPGTLNLASGAGGQGGANEIHFWSLDKDTPLSTLQGHTDRVCRVEFHPSGKYLASASFDTTWRLWDVETTTELLLQEGHSRQVFTVSFNTDGSLLASGGFDSIGRIWDLRSGRTVMILDGHIREIYALDWGIDGYRVLSGSGDGWVKCWDIRQVRGIGALGAHNGNVSDLRWFKGIDGDTTTPSDVAMENGVKQERLPRKAGTFFVSSGFDKNVNIYSADDWALARQLRGHSGNVLSVDVSNDAKWIASSGHDRTVKLWGRDDGLGI
jgi:U4/U6 small nuclear ribonucleoprotein PRP4